jgi:hypothetical protein
MKEYIHRKPGEETQVGPWSCRVVEERGISVNGGELLYIIGDALVGSSCVGAGSLRYIQVPGFITRRHFRLDIDGSPVSAVEPVMDDTIRAVIQKTLSERHPGLQVCF